MLQNLLHIHLGSSIVVSESRNRVKIVLLGYVVVRHVVLLRNAPKAIYLLNAPSYRFKQSRRSLISRLAMLKVQVRLR